MDGRRGIPGAVLKNSGAVDHGAHAINIRAPVVRLYDAAQIERHEFVGSHPPGGWPSTAHDCPNAVSFPVQGSCYRGTDKTRSAD